ncbi:hypothetical protein NPIL_476811, partial [Nephila pilipes]
MGDRPTRRASASLQSTWVLGRFQVPSPNKLGRFPRWHCWHRKSLGHMMQPRPHS